jgi:hypothetical protein
MAATSLKLEKVFWRMGNLPLSTGDLPALVSFGHASLAADLAEWAASGCKSNADEVRGARAGALPEALDSGAAVEDLHVLSVRG